MKKALIIIGCFLVIVLAWVCFAYLPAKSIERRVADIGAGTITREFDDFLILKGMGQVDYSVESLPSSLRALSPLNVRRGRDGIYIVMKHSFILEDGISITFPGKTQTFGKDTDPSYFSLGNRVYRYHISG